MKVRLFQKGFESGRVLWLQGASGPGALTQAYQWLKRCCEISSESVLQITPQQFIDMSQVGVSRFCSALYPVMIIRDFEFLDHRDLTCFLSAMMLFQKFQEAYRVRVLLISSERFLYTQLFVKNLKPVIIRTSGNGNEPEDLNERIHTALECAAGLTNKRVTQISEPVANFLEIHGSRCSDPELIALLSSALVNLDGSILRLKHFPQKRIKNNQKLAGLNSSQVIAN